ncbi:hypothetical protein EVAR_65029_1 [Eumeta japonica]|uniref:Uncharacterized protein n=1 Tax=Eumeta variegata TaxID=151549 RepID=A0A4C1YQ73_EUMVA|nr:hypothetical protein EVAR_65029_1 [Eumeta japonica]
MDRYRKGGIGEEQISYPSAASAHGSIRVDIPSSYPSIDWDLNNVPERYPIIESDSGPVLDDNLSHS